MPHQCTDCGTTFEDGSTEMLSGCPSCGGNTFQFLPDGADTSPAPEADPPEKTPDRSTSDSTVARTVGSAAATVRDIVGSDPDGAGTDPDAADPLSPSSADETAPSSPDETVDSATDTGTTPDESPDASIMSNMEAGSVQRDSVTTNREDAAQASARSAVVSPGELPETADETDVSGRSQPGAGARGEAPVEGPEDERPDLETLRDELNDQFESIRIVEPGQYELNLMELYERDEYIIALREDGRYRIQVPGDWRD
ncbi:OapC/ArvC family zinc-ribbon domain-containing protein [Halorhabdus salina]|uniref:OapC/ArvC family zinc-ribbon domain-containing protein n=1 Tax=Halorhabdus salina TaxID=2750670 RepID=UPI0015EFA70B|nr:Zn-ribbon containing protein [Halorhabdus salina]